MNVKKLTIHQKIEALDREMEWFYSDDFKLEEATERYQRAIKSAQEIVDDLKKIKNEVKILSEDFSK